MKEKTRCGWATGAGELDQAYHDAEWGVPLHDDTELFAFLCLEGAQAGLSWSTILKKRDAYMKAFAGFDPKKVARFDNKKVAALLQNEGIVRNRLKVASCIKNAKGVLAIQKEFGSFDTYIWSFVGGKPVQNNRKKMSEIPASTPASEAMSKALKKRGFGFVGPTICYAFMQAVGMVNDHTIDCFRHRAVQRRK